MVDAAGGGLAFATVVQLTVLKTLSSKGIVYRDLRNRSYFGNPDQQLTTTVVIYLSVAVD